MSISSLSSLGSPSQETVPVQPDHFYGQPGNASPDVNKGYLDPNDDPFATRGIPVFKPNIEDFNDFEGYMNKIECWGMRSGIVKIIPPKEWFNALPSAIPQLAHVKLRNPIEQQMVGRGGLFRQQNMEKRRIMSVREWAELCAKEDHRAPTIDEAQGGRRHAPGTTRSRTRRGRASVPSEEHLNENGEGAVEEDKVDEDKMDDSQKGEEGASDHNVDHDSNIPTGEWKADADFDVDPASTLPTPPPTTHSSDTLPPGIDTSPTPTSTKRSAAERKEAKDALDAAFLATFDPHKDWLPHGMVAEDYTPEFCRVLERIYWRNCSLGRAPWYGADMMGSLFTEVTKHWNVADLPSVLSRLLGNDSKISGVNTPYLYFGMWRATFAWHVEDMDLFSINYIHFGSPKHWYAVPQARAQALETTMRGYFPQDNANCPQFLRHKSFLASPTLLSQSSVRPNILVQHAGEFVVTFPRGYHAGFNLGFNCAESVNFALGSWIHLGLRAAFCACEADSVRIDVKGLIEAKECREREGVPELEEKISPSRKRKAEVLLGINSQEGSMAKRPKVSKAFSPSPDSVSVPSQPRFSKLGKPKARPVDVDAGVSFPCCLCPATSTDDLLRVHDPPLTGGILKPVDGVWRAHESCARVVPETWVDEVPLNDGSSGVEKVVWGVDGIVKDRWLLRCAACTRPRFKAHGAPIQCTKGKCSKAFHVSCAANSAASGSGIAYRVLEDIEKEVVLLEPEVEAPSSLSPPMVVNACGMVMDSKAPSCSSMPSTPKPLTFGSNAKMETATSHTPESVSQQPGAASSSEFPSATPPIRDGPKVIKTIKKLLVEVLCSQHNPVVIAQKKVDKDQKLRTDLAALPEMSRIRIRNTSGVFEVSLVKVHEERGTVEVLWDSGQKREFRWGSIVWSADAQPTGSKPTAEGGPDELSDIPNINSTHSTELAKYPPSLLSDAPATTAPRPPSHATNTPKQQFTSFSQSGHIPYPYVHSPDQPGAASSRIPGYQSMEQPGGTDGSSAQPRHWSPSSNAYTSVQSAVSPANGTVQPPHQDYYSHPYYQHSGYASARASASSSSSASPQPVTLPPHLYNCSLPPHFANYYRRAPYLPLAPRTVSAMSSATGAAPATAKGTSAAEPSNESAASLPSMVSTSASMPHHSFDSS